MTTAKAIKRGWRYPCRGDYPSSKERDVLVHVADIEAWVKAMVKGEIKATVAMFEQNSKYQGKVGGVDVWSGIPFHCVVTAWRELSAPPDTDKEKDAIAGFQSLAAERADVLKWLLVSAYRFDPAKNDALISGLTKKFNKAVERMKEDIIKGTDDCTAFAYDNGQGLVFDVEQRHGHGVIVQTAPGAKSRYAFDFPKPRRIYPTAQAAALALLAEAERQKWRRVG